MGHRKALNDLAEGYGYSFFWHDLDKVFLYPILGQGFSHISPTEAGLNNHYRDGYPIEPGRFRLLSWDRVHRN